jgi:hypothetical protein
MVTNANCLISINPKASDIYLAICCASAAAPEDQLVQHGDEDWLSSR